MSLRFLLARGLHKKSTNLFTTKQRFLSTTSTRRCLSRSFFTPQIMVTPFKHQYCSFSTLKQGAEPIDVIKELQTSTSFETEELRAIYSRFLKEGGGELNLEEFTHYMHTLGLKDANLIKQYFQAFDSDRNGYVDFREFASNLSLLLRGKNEDKYKFVFDLWDPKHTGTITKQDFYKFLESVSRANGESIPSQEVGEIFDDVDKNGNGLIDFQEFKLGIARHQMILPGIYVKGNDKKEQLQEEIFLLIGERKEIPANTEINALAQDYRFVYALVEGKLEISTLGEGSKVLETVSRRKGEPYMLFGEESLFRKSYCSIKTATPVVVIQIDAKDFLPLVYHNHAGAIALMEELGTSMMKRLQHFEEAILDKRSAFSTSVQTEFANVRNYLNSEWALRYHSLGSSGKLGIHATKNVGTQQDLSVAYSPGVAQPCLAIKHDPSKVYEYTSKGHLVGVVSNGTAVLGLGNIGALASKPVMEGKAVLFKKFADLDSFDIEINESNMDKLIDIVVSLEPTFGGINLEDIGAPDCFRIEKECQRRMNIPIMHDDQHGTAIVAGAALLNALQLIKKDIGDLKVIVNGCGAAGFTCAKFLISLGVKKENLMALDIKGVVHNRREDLVRNPSLYLNEVACEDNNIRTLEEAIVGADLFLGLSVGNVLTPAMLKTMNRDPLVFALANPTPEINFHVARSTREDVIMATGRSDFPNQINNVCAFPFIFRGALDCKATKINEQMKQAASKAIASLVQPTDLIPGVKIRSDLLAILNANHRPLSRDFILPKPFDKRLAIAVSAAVAQAAAESGVARNPLDITEYKVQLLDLLKRRV